MVVRVTDDRQHPVTQPPREQDPPTEALPAAATPTPVLVASGLGVRGNAGWIFRDVDLRLPAGSLTAVVGSAGCGRSSLLLALAGRMKPTAGSLSVLGHNLADDPSAVRNLTSIARAASTVRPEPALTVRESVGERCLIDDVGPVEGRNRFQRACTVLQFAPDPSAPVESVTGERAALLAVALAYVRTGAVILLDDVDRDVRSTTRQGLMRALRRLAATGPAIVVTATDRAAVPDADLTVELPLPAGRTEWSFNPDSAPAAQPEASQGDAR